MILRMMMIRNLMMILIQIMTLMITSGSNPIKVTNVDKNIVSFILNGRKEGNAA